MSFRRIAPLVVLAGVLASPAAYAAPLSKSGEIKSINAVKHEIHLASGETFSLPKTYDFKKLKVGEKVTVSYERKGSRMKASDVTTRLKARSIHPRQSARLSPPFEREGRLYFLSAASLRPIRLRCEADDGFNSLL